MGYNWSVNSQNKISVAHLAYSLDSTPSTIKNMAQGSVSWGHYSNQFDCNDPQLLALALFIFHLADFREPLHLWCLAFLKSVLEVSLWHPLKRCDIQTLHEIWPYFMYWHPRFLRARHFQITIEYRVIYFFTGCFVKLVLIRWAAQC